MPDPPPRAPLSAPLFLRTPSQFRWIHRNCCGTPPYLPSWSTTVFPGRTPAPPTEPR